jgi:altronate dehydratase small subunit
MKRILLVHEDDDVGNAINDIKKGEDFEYTSNAGAKQLAALEDIPFGFKAAVKDILAGKDIKKYGQVIGRASRDIKAGECVHIHNVEGTRGRGDQGGAKR